MKIKFDFGATKSIPPYAVWGALNYIFSYVQDKHSLHPGKCTVYVTLYDDEGLDAYDIVEDGAKELNFLIRGKKYTSEPKNVYYVAGIAPDKESPAGAYIYRQYEEIKD